MTSWPDGPFLGFDTETTGVDVGRDRIVTAALVRRDATGTSVRTWIIDPGVEIPAPAAAIHGVSTRRARAEGAPPARALEEIAEEIARAQREGVPLVAYNAAFDLALLERELRRHGLVPLAERLGHDCMPVIDPLVLDRALDPGRQGRRTLGDLCLHYAVADGADLHTAEVDVVATLDVLGRIAARYPDLAGRTLTELHDWQVVHHRTWAEGVRTARAERGASGPGPDTGWPMPVGPSAPGRRRVRGWLRRPGWFRRRGWFRRPGRPRRR